MREMETRLFRRTAPVTVSVAGGVYARRGLVRPLKRADTEAGDAFCGVWGRAENPLFIYTGDAAELLDGPDACLSAGADTYRVLRAEAVNGFHGRLCVRAIMERQVADEGQ